MLSFSRIIGVGGCLAAAMLPGIRGTRAATPLNDLGSGLYLGQFQGGLYPNGLNSPPLAHALEGISRAGQIQPLNTLGQPDPVNGKYVLLSIGMSNTAQEFAGGNTSTTFAPYSFMGQAAAHPAVNHEKLVIFNGARGGQSAATWDSPSDDNYERVRSELQAAGLSEAQVTAVWVKQANPGPNTSLPSPQADAYTLVTQLGNISRAVRQRYPNVKTVFFTSRTYGGYATTTLNPEPYAYESGLAVKWLIEAQIRQMAGQGIDPRAGDLNYTSAAPFLAWGPYIWADGTNPRSDGLTWARSDFGPDGTHPATTGRAKVGGMLLRFLLHSELSKPWFVDADAQVLPGDATLDGRVNIADLAQLARHWQQAGNWQMGDFNTDGLIDRFDLDLLAMNWQATAGDVSNLALEDALATVGLADVVVPEPTAAAMLAGFGAFMAGARSRNNTRRQGK